jgi:hypothetical protein
MAAQRERQENNLAYESYLRVYPVRFEKFPARMQELHSVHLLTVRILQKRQEKMMSTQFQKDHMLSPVIVLPEQFHDRSTAVMEVNGNLALMRAVLEDAINCFQRRFLSKSRRVKRIGEEAEAWLFTDDPTWPFSCVNICLTLGIDIDALRGMLIRWAQQQHSNSTLRQPCRGRDAKVTLIRCVRDRQRKEK